MYLGIDLGTSNSAVVGNRGGRLELFKAISGEDVLASVVMCDRSGSRYVGKRAYDQLRTSPKGIAARFKRLLGTSTVLPFGPEDGTITPEDASAEVLRQLLKQVRSGAGDVVFEGAVVTVPAAFTPDLPASPVNAEDISDGAEAMVEATIEPTVTGPEGVVSAGKILLREVVVSHLIHPSP